MERHFRIDYVMDYRGGMLRRPIDTYYEAMLFASKMVHLGVWLKATITEVRDGEPKKGAIIVDRSQALYMFGARRKARDYAAQDAHNYMCMATARRSCSVTEHLLGTMKRAQSWETDTDRPKLLDRRDLDSLADTLGIGRLPAGCNMFRILSNSIWTDSMPGTPYYVIEYPDGEVGLPHRNRTGALREANEYMEHIEL